MSPTSTHHAPRATTPRRRIVVVGGGIAGAETALTLAVALRDARVTLVGAWPSIRLLPDLVYVPFGVSPRRLDVPVAVLAPHGVHGVVADVQSVDMDRQRLETSVGAIEFDVLVAAPGAAVAPAGGPGFRTLADALRIRGALEELCCRARKGLGSSVLVRAGSDDAWSAPACELAVLLGSWIRSQGLTGLVTTTLATSDSEACSWFGPAAGAAINAALRRSRVHVLTGVPAGSLPELDADLAIDLGGLEPRTIPGLPGRGATGWYEVDDRCLVAPDAYVVGDATRWPFRAGFATAWQARRVLGDLGGDVASLGASVDGIPTSSVEYQMDLADGQLLARMEHAGALARPFLGHDFEVEVVPGGRPDKLLGLLLHDRVLRWRGGEHDAPMAFRDVLLANSLAERSVHPAACGSTRLAT